MTFPQGLMPVVLAIAVAMKAAERRIVDQLRVAGATEHGRATSIHVRGPIARFRLKRLLSASSIKADALDRYYLDEVAYAALQRTRRLRALAAIVVILAGTAVAWAVGVVRF
jgi:hypothetical protein